MLNFSLFYFIFLTICEIDPRMVRVKGSFFYVKVVFWYIFLYLQASRDWVLLKIINIFGSVYTYRSQDKSSLEQGDEITTGDEDNDDDLIPQRCLTDEEADFWTGLFIEKCATSYKVIYKFWKTSPLLFGFIFWTLKTEEQKFSDKGFATRKETPGRFFNCVWLKIALLQIESWHLNFEK